MTTLPTKDDLQRLWLEKVDAEGEVLKAQEKVRVASKAYWDAWDIVKGEYAPDHKPLYNTIESNPKVCLLCNREHGPSERRQA